MSSTDQGTPMVDFAQAYGQAGRRVLPIYEIRDGACACGNANCSNPGKHPRTRNGFKDATTDPAQIVRWWSRWPYANIGIATGDDLAVIDLDGPSGQTKLQALAAEHGPLPETAISNTSRGQHYWFLIPEGYGPVPCSTGDGLDVRGEGGYVIAPPSRHISGHEYEWCTTAIAEAPGWFPDWARNRKGAARLSSSNRPATLNGRTLPDNLAKYPQRDTTARLDKSLRTPWSPAEQIRLESALKAIPSDDYETWITVGMAL